MKALVFERNGESSDVLSRRALPDAKVGANEVLVRMRVAPVHPSDLHVIRGRFARQPALPASPGGEGMDYTHDAPLALETAWMQQRMVTDVAPCG